MKFLLSLAAVLLSLPLHAADPAGAAVTLPYQEFRSLLEAGKVTPSKELPIPFAILSTRFRLDPGAGSLSGSATFDVRSFRDGGQLIPLISDSVLVSQTEPADSAIVIKDGYYNLLVEGQKRQSVTLRIEWPGKRDGETTLFECGVQPAATSMMEIVQVPQGMTIGVAGAVQEEKSGIWHLGSAGKLELRIARKSLEKPGTVVAMPAVVREAASTMRIVSDGTFFNATTWKIRHNTAVTLRLNLGNETQVVSCLVSGRPAAPLLIDAQTIELKLPENAAGTTVELSYTGKSAAFAPVRGDFSVSLPSTDLLVERSDWVLILPAAYSPLAVEGNCDFFPGESKNELRLRKELCRNESPAIRVFYQKPETTKKP